MKNSYYIINIILAFCLISCTQDIETVSTVGSIVGSVSDQTTGEPISTVNVKLTPSGQSTVTGSDGSFSFVDIKEGNYTISITKEGYKSNNSVVYIPGGEVTPLHLLLERIPASLISDKNLLDFGESLETLSFTIINTGYSDLKFEVTAGDCQWISVDPQAETIEYGKTATIVVTIDREILPKGNNEANIVVRSTSGNGNVEVKVLAINNAGASVNTLDVTNITNTTATLNGEIINPGSPSYTDRGFIYSTNSNPTIENCIKKVSSSVNSNNQYSCDINGLSSNITYYVKSYIVQNGNTIYGNTVSFSTSQQATVFSTSAVTQIGASSAIFNATISNEGTPSYTERGFCYSKNSTPTISDNKKRVSGTGVGDFSIQVTDLDYPMAYYVRAYVIQNDEVIYANIVKFTTETRNVKISTSAVTNVSYNSATFNGVITDEGLPTYTEKGFCYSKNSTPTISDNKKKVSGTGTGDYSIQVSDLEYPKTYYVRAYAIQNDEVIYANVVKFATETRNVEVSTSAVTDVSYNSATFNGSIIDAGLPAYSQRGFCYSYINSEPNVSDEKWEQYASVSGNYYRKISNLKEGKTYYVRAFAVQDNQYIYGNTVSFSTYLSPSIQTESISSLERYDISGLGAMYKWRVTFNATIYDEGYPSYSERGFVYGTSSTGGEYISVSGKGSGHYSKTLDNIDDYKTYYVRAYVKVNGKYYYGETIKFNTY